MRDSDLTSFQAVMSRLASVFGKRSEDLTTLVPAYFRALQRYDISDVTRAADALIASEQHFPRPARWVQAVHDAPKSDPLPEMSPQEAQDWLGAEKLGFEGQPCGCEDCVDSGVADRPTRFVPIEPHDRRLLRNREVVRGRWIHAWELAAWYRARADFYEVALRLKLGHPIRDLVVNL